MCKNRTCKTACTFHNTKNKIHAWVQSCHHLQIPANRSAIGGQHLLSLFMPEGVRLKKVRMSKAGRFQFEYEIDNSLIESKKLFELEVHDACDLYDECCPRGPDLKAPLFDIDRAGFPNESSRLYADFATSPSKKRLQVLEAMIDHLDEEITIYMKDLGSNVWFSPSLVETIRAQRLVIGNCDRRTKLIELCRSAIRGEQAKVKRLISQYRLV